jgi:hypothetical protein
MTDPLSITASIVALLQLTQRVLEFCVSARGANNERSSISNELISTQDVLYQLLQTAAINAKDGSTRTLAMIHTAGGPLDQYSECLEALRSKLAPEREVRKAIAAFKWPFRRDEVLAVVAKIERLKSLFALAQQEDHM